MQRRLSRVLKVGFVPEAHLPYKSREMKPRAVLEILWKDARHRFSDVEV